MATLEERLRALEERLRQLERRDDVDMPRAAPRRLTPADDSRPAIDTPPVVRSAPPRIEPVPRPHVAASPAPDVDAAKKKRLADTRELMGLLDGFKPSDRERAGRIQQKLKDIGLYEGSVDKSYGTISRRAEQDFRTQYAEEMKLIAQEREQARRKAQEERIGRIGDSLQTIATLDAAKRKALEQDLKEAGFNPGTVDGVFDSQAYRAMRSFAGQHPDTRQQFTARAAALSAMTPATMTKEQVTELQTSLQVLGFGAGAVDGTFGVDTARARDAFVQLALTEAKPAELHTNPAAARKLQSELKRLGYFKGPESDTVDMRTVASLNQLATRHPHLGLSQIATPQEITSHHLTAAEFVSHTEGKWAALEGVKIVRGAITNDRGAPVSVALDPRGNIVGGNRPFDKADPMSVSKMMTLYTIAEMGRAGELPGGMSAEKFLARYSNLVNNMMVYSHNDAPYNLALLATGTLKPNGTVISGDGAAFVERMNQTGRELGLVDTHFSSARKSMARTFTSGSRFTGEVGPVGYNDGVGGQYITAFDGARIGQTFAQRHPGIFGQYVNDYGIYKGKTGTGAGDYDRHRGTARSFIGVNRDGSAFSIMEVPPGQFEDYKDRMSRMARGVGPRGSGNIFENLIDSIDEFLQGGGPLGRRSSEVDFPLEAPRTPSRRRVEAPERDQTVRG